MFVSKPFLQINNYYHSLKFIMVYTTVSDYKAAVEKLKQAIDSPACANKIFETSKWPNGEISNISNHVKTELTSGEKILTVPGDGDGKDSSADWLTSSEPDVFTELRDLWIKQAKEWCVVDR